MSRETAEEVEDRSPREKDAERLVGITAYLSKSPGIGGSIKAEPKDFIVEEITPENVLLEVGKSQPFESGSGDYTHFTVEKNNWDTIRAAKTIAKSAGVSQKRIKYAGTKDRRSISTQRMSIWKVSPERLAKVKIKDMILRDFALSEEPINLGTLAGNKFTVTIAGVSKDADKKVQEIVHELDRKIPNFFGLQRFGLRFNNQIVGEHILKGEFKEAVMAYLCDTGNEPENATAARQKLRETEDFKTAFKEFPNYLGFEKSVLNRLAREPTDFIGAFRELPKKLRWMFVHSCQGYVFNLALSECIKRGEIPKELPLVGYDTKPDEITENVLKREGISLDEFKVNAMPEMSLVGEMRETLAGFGGFEILDFNASDCNIRVRFSLPPGAYATMLLRELMK